jgi:phospholipid/cholesterol/gamma-HCH transport system substrate-binding protein
VKAFTERRPKVIGAIVIVAIATVVALVIFFNRSFFQSGYDVSARFPNAAGISKGTAVLLAGVPVGTVDSVTIDGNGVDATMTIDHGVVLPRRTAADVEVETLLGVVDVTLQPLGGWSRPLHQGALLTDTSVPTEFYQLSNEAGHLLERSNAGALNQLVEELAAITKGKQQQVAEIIEGLGKLLGTVSDRSAQVSQLIDSSNTLAATLAQHDQQLATAIGALDTVASGLASRSTQLASLIDNVDAVAAQTNSLLGQDRPQIDSLIQNLTATLGVVNQHQDDLAEGVSYLAGAIKGFASIGYSGSTPLTWANIYVSTTGLTGTAGVLGACGPFTVALDDALGPTPVPCATRTAPLGSTSPVGGLLPGSPGSAASTSGQSGSANSGSISSTPLALGLGLGSKTSSASPDSDVGGLSQLFSPLLGGGP